MATLHYTIDINAPKQTVWHSMLDPETYKLWTAGFYPGSTYEGSWDKGSEIHFVADGDGMFSHVIENIPYEYVSVEHLGEIIKGQKDTTSENAQFIKGAHESYRFTEDNGVTTVDVELTSEGESDAMAKMFDGMWPKALQSLKEVCERSNPA